MKLSLSKAEVIIWVLRLEHMELLQLPWTHIPFPLFATLVSEPMVSTVILPEIMMSRIHLISGPSLNLSSLNISTAQVPPLPTLSVLCELEATSPCSINAESFLSYYPDALKARPYPFLVLRNPGEIHHINPVSDHFNYQGSFEAKCCFGIKFICTVLIWQPKQITQFVFCTNYYFSINLPYTEALSEVLEKTSLNYTVAHYNFFIMVTYYSSSYMKDL